MKTWLKWLIVFLIGAIVGYLLCRFVFHPCKPEIVTPGTERATIFWVPANFSDWSEDGLREVRNFIPTKERLVEEINEIEFMDTTQLRKIEELFGDSGRLVDHDGNMLRTGQKIREYFQDMIDAGVIIKGFKIKIEVILAYEYGHILNNEAQAQTDKVQSVEFTLSTVFDKEFEGKTTRIDPPGDSTWWHIRSCDWVSN